MAPALQVGAAAGWQGPGEKDGTDADCYTGRWKCKAEEQGGRGSADRRLLGEAFRSKGTILAKLT